MVGESERIEKNGLVKLPNYPATRVCIKVVWKRVFMNHFSYYLIARLSTNELKCYDH